VRGEAPEYRVEKRYVRKNGSIAWVNVNMTVISAAAGQSARTIATIEDISERKRAEEALRESEERFRNIFEHAGMGISIAHLDGRFVQCNPAFCGITGYSMEELSGMEFSSLLHPGDREENMRLIRELVDREIPSFGIENRYISKTGETVWVRKFSTILRNDEGYPTHLLSLVTDITSRMRKNAALQRQAELLHLSHDAIFVWNTESGIEYWNKGATDLYGFHASEIRGRVSRELLKAGFPVPWPQIEAELRERGCWEGEVRHTTKAGGEVIVASRLQLVPDGGGSLLVLETNRDITDRRRLEREILEISESERRNFGQELHDDLGQQLTGVMMMSGILADDLRKKSPRQADDLEELVRLLKHAMHSARRMAKGLYPTELRDGDLVLAIEGLANTVAATSGIPCELRYDPAFHFKNPDAAIHLYRIVQEALNNAVRHGGASRIAVECSASPERLTITVTNDGRHFTHPPKESHGMGLSLMEHRAHLLGGELAFRPLKTGGCEVICSIPAKQSDAS
jgi:PAS domain S-box-containing protein